MLPQPPTGFAEVPSDLSLPKVLALLPHVHPRAAVAWQEPGLYLQPGKVSVAWDARYFAHRPDWAPWPEALPTAGAGDVGFGSIARGWLSSEPTGTALGVGINPAKAVDLAARWPTPQAAELEFETALYGSDAVELDLVFMRAHALHRWDLLPGWYSRAWLVRGTVRSFAPPTGKPAAPFVAAPANATGTPSVPNVWLVTGWDAAGAPQFALAPASWKPSNGLAGTTPTPYPYPPPYFPGLQPLSAPPPWVLAPPPRDVARGDGFDTLPAVASTDAHGSSFAWWWSKGSALVTPPAGYGLQSKYLGAHNWAFLWKTQANSVEGLKWVPVGQSLSKPPDKWLSLSEWKGPYVEPLIALAFEADELRDSQAWQERAAAWWQGYLTWCPQFGMPHTAGELPPLWQRPTVTYRPHWWIIDADWLRERLDVPAPKVQTPLGPVDDWDWHADAFRAAIVEWIAEGAHVVDPYELDGHAVCEHWAEGPDLVDILGLVFALGVVAVIAPAAAAQLVGAFGFAGTSLGGVLADLGASTIGSGLGAEATGGSFAEGVDDVFDDPLDIVLDVAGAGVGDLLDLDPGFVEELLDDPLEVLEDLGAEFLEDVLEVDPGTIETALDVLEGEETFPMDFFDEFIPDSFGEALDLAGDAIDLYEGVEDILDLFNDDDDFLGGIGGVFGGGADGGGQTPPFFEGGLSNDTALGLGEDDDGAPSSAGSFMGSLAPLLALGLLVFVAVRA